MIILLTGSAGVAVWFHNKMVPQEQVQPKKARVKPFDEGFDNIMAAGAALKQTIRLRRQVDSITEKRVLTKSDSLNLMQDLDSLQHIRINLKK